MKKIKHLAIFLLMITFITLLSTKAKAAEVEEDKQYTLSQTITTKTLPLINVRDKGTIESGNITVLEIINDWCRIGNETQDGWVRVNTLEKSITENTEIPTEPEPENTGDEQTPETPEDGETTGEEEPTDDNTSDSDEEIDLSQLTELDKTGYVNADGLNVRAEPDTSSELLDSLSRNDRLDITGEIDGWYRIDLDGQVGYVSAKYVSDTRVEEETTSRGGNVDRTQNTTTEEPVKEETTTETNQTSGTGAEVVEYAKQYLGYKYVAGGSSPSTGFDCSGFTTYVYKNFGISLNRSSSGQNKNGVSVSRNELQLGDLVIFNNDSNSAIVHVGIYVGGGNFIHSANPSEGVKITSLSSSYYSRRYVGARRVI